VLAANAGLEGSIVVQEIKRRKGNEGYNVATNEYEDLSKRASWIPQKSHALLSRTPGPSLAYCSPPSV
jgi:chaperonin GroEL (HSP60 family)